MAVCVSLSPIVSKAPIVTSSPVKRSPYSSETKLLQKLKKRHYNYLKRSKKQLEEAPEEKDSLVWQSIDHAVDDSVFDKEPLHLANHIISKVKVKMKRSQRLRLSQASFNQKLKIEHQPFKSPGTIKKRTILPPINQSSSLTTQSAKEYSSWYKEIQKKWYEHTKQLTNSPSPLCVDKAQNPRTLRDETANGKSLREAKRVSGVVTGNLLPRRRLEFNESTEGNSQISCEKVSGEKIHEERKILPSSTRESTVKNSPIKTMRSNDLILTHTRSSPNKKKEGVKTREAPLAASNRDAEEKRAAATKLKQERVALKAAQRAEIYALNAIMKAFEESNHNREIAKRF